MLTKEEFEKLINSIKEKLDETTQALISDDLVGVLSSYGNALDEIASLGEKITGLETDKEELLKVNGRLFQKVGFDKEEDAVISDAKGRIVLCGPGLNGVPNETMKQLYERLEGWRIGVKLNEAYVLSPAKSFGGWFEAEGTTPGVDHICRLGVGCQFCILRGCDT